MLEEEELPPMKIWDGSLEFGLDGASGNNESFNLRLGLSAKRRTPLNAFTLQLGYFKKTNQYVETANRLFGESRLEHFFLGSPWTCFVHGTIEYDEFTTYRVRLTSDVGLGRKLIDTDRILLIARCGAGAAGTFRKPYDQCVPEAVFGLDLEHRVAKHHRVVFAVDYMPDMTDFGHYRIITQGGWEYLLAQEINLSLKLGVLDRYDSTPHGKEPNDLDYAALLLWKF